MELTDKLLGIINKVGVVKVSPMMVIDGIPLGLMVDVTSDDMKTVIETIKQIPDLTNRVSKTTVMELIPHFGGMENAHKFMFLAGLLCNKFKTPIFTITPFGNFDVIHYQGDLVNVALVEDKKETKAEPTKVTDDVKAEKKVKAEKPKKESKKESKAVTTKKAETKSRGKSSTKK